MEVEIDYDKKIGEDEVINEKQVDKNPELNKIYNNQE